MGLQDSLDSNYCVPACLSKLVKGSIGGKYVAMVNENITMKKQEALT